MKKNRMRRSRRTVSAKVLPSPKLQAPPSSTGDRQPSPLRILMVIDQFNIGGTETHVLAITRQLIRRGACVVVSGKRGKMLDSFAALGCPIYEIEYVLDNHKPNRERAAEHIDVLKAVIGSERIDIVHGHQIPSGAIAHAAAEQMNVPFVFTAHGIYYNSTFLRSLQPGCSMISVSPAVARFLADIGIESVVIPNGLDTVEYAPYGDTFLARLRRSMGITQDAFVILYAGRLSWEKADICKEIILACAALIEEGCSHVRLLIAGGGKKELEVRALSELVQDRLGNPFIHFAGETLYMRPYYAVSDVVIGTGRVALESMACQRPLIAVGTKGYVGLMTPDDYELAWDSWFGDHASERLCSEAVLADEIRKLVNGSGCVSDHWLKAGRDLVGKRFSIQSAAARLLFLYGTLARQTVPHFHKH